MNIYRCIRKKLEQDDELRGANILGREYIQCQRGYYIVASSSEEAVDKISQFFAEDKASITVKLWLENINIRGLQPCL